MNETAIRKGTIMKTLTLALLGLVCLLALPNIAHARYRDGMSMYQYVQSQPVRFSDPYGLQASQPACVCGPDVTEWLLDEVNIHGKFFRDNPQGPGAAALIFKAYAARISYKWMSFEIAGECPKNEKCKDTVTLAGACIHKSDMGNIMFAAMGYISIAPAPAAIVKGGLDAAANKTGGIDSPEDMASSIAGLNVGLVMWRQNADKDQKSKELTLEAFKKAISEANPDIQKVLLDNWEGQTAAWIKGASPNPLATTSTPYSRAGCAPCGKAIPRNQAHSNFDHFRGKDAALMLDGDQWWEIWRGAKGDYVDNSGIPFPKK